MLDGRLSPHQTDDLAALRCRPISGPAFDKMSKNRLKVIHCSNECAVVEKEDVEEEIGMLVFDAKEERVKGESKEKRCEWISLLSAGGGGETVVAKEEML